MAKFVIQGGKKLYGEIKVQGAKNAATPCLAASILVSGDLVLENIPRIRDVERMLVILKKIGARVENDFARHKIRINTRGVKSKDLDFPEVFAMRSSILLIGPMLARFGQVKILHPGGCHIGARPIRVHLDALETLGVKVRQDKKYYCLETKGMKAGEVILPEFSVTATENIMMAACLAPGKTVIKLAASEPHVQDLATFLNKAGADVTGAGTSTIVIEGVSRLSAVKHRIIPDMIEAGTFIIAGLVTRGKVKVTDLSPRHLDIFLKKLEEADAIFQKGKNFVQVFPTKTFKPVAIQTLPYPGFPTDLQAPFAVLLTQARGRSLIHDPMYEGRLKYLEELKKMGAKAKILDIHRAEIIGPTRLFGRKITSFDLRAGATLILAALIAKGKSELFSAEEVDRGYERIEERLAALGADIRRID